MNAFIKTFDEKLFIEKIRKLNPKYIFVGSEVIKTLNGYENFYGQVNVTTGYKGRFNGVPVFCLTEVRSDEIIFGVE